MKINIAGINENDTANGEGVCVSLFLQGCPFHCKGCHNPETWNPDGGKTLTFEVVIAKILSAIEVNGIQRNLSILGGEPLYDDNNNLNFVIELIDIVKDKFPNIKISIWTGYLYEDLQKIDFIKRNILERADYLIDGPFILEERDITLKWRGSRNQRIIDLQKSKKEGEVVLYE